MKKLAVAAVVVLAAAAGWFLRGAGDESAATRARVAATPARSTAAGAPHHANDSAPAIGAPVRSPLWARPPARATPTLFGEYLRAAQFRPLYDRLKDAPEGQTSEGRLVLYEILRECTEAGRRFGYRGTVPGRDTFLASIPAADPQRDRRIAAYETFTRDRCAGFDGVKTSRDELMALLAEAAQGGDPKARAIAMEQQMLQARRDSNDGRITITDAQVRTLQEIAASKDPEAIRAAGRVLSTGWADYGLRLANDASPIEPRPFMNAWLVLACEYGAACDANTPRMLQACAIQGYCDAEAFPDFMFHYQSSPHDSQRVLQYRGVLRYAIETGDWSQLVVVRGAEAGAHRTTFVPGYR